MNGAQSLVRSITHNGVEVCFANPGTSEMHFVAALDRTPQLRCVLALFEGVATGAADGYGRMSDRPAATLLHLGPGLANGLSNLHNATRAHSPIVNIIGDHASYHRYYDAPLTSDVEGTARPFSHWVRTSANADAVAGDAAAAIAAASTNPGRIASLILPADTAWKELEQVDATPPTARPSRPQPVSSEKVDAAARILRRAAPTAIILNSRATREGPLRVAGKIADATDAVLLTPTHTARITRGAGRVEVNRIPYGVDLATELIHRFQNVILVGVKPPVAFFAYPDKPSELHAPGTLVHELSRADQDSAEALDALAEALRVHNVSPRTAPLDPPAPPTGSFTLKKLGQAIAALLPDDAIVVDESITSGRAFLADTRTARPHDWILSTGGSIGYALASAVGAAIASPGRKVVVLESDGSGMYMPQALWTHARENLDIVTLVFANRKYQILRDEMRSVGADFGGGRAETLMDLENPTIDWVTLANSLGVEASRARNLDELVRQMRTTLRRTGPSLIEVVL